MMWIRILCLLGFAATASTLTIGGKCGENAMFSTCANAGCGYRNCSQIGGPMLCVDPIQCLGGCICQSGYLLQEEINMCVPEAKCKKCGPNEWFSPCANADCRAQLCSQLRKPVPCADPITCVGDCSCLYGYLRETDGRCVPENECKV